VKPVSGWIAKTQTIDNIRVKKRHMQATTFRIQVSNRNNPATR
jgi:hypothetical protein